MQLIQLYIIGDNKNNGIHVMCPEYKRLMQSTYSNNEIECNVLQWHVTSEIRNNFTALK